VRATREILGVSLVTTLLLTFGISTCHSHNDKRERIAALEAQVSEARHRADSLAHIVDSVTRNVTSQIASNRKVGRRLSERLAANDSILSAYALMDGANDTTQALMIAIQRTTEVARLYRDSTEVVLASVADLISAHEPERQGNLKLLAAKDSVISALTATECRMLFLPCPSRVQSVGIGAGLVLLLLLGGL